MGFITFIKDADTFTFSKGREYPLYDPVKVNVVSDYSEGRKLYVYDKGIQEQFFQISFKGLPKTDYDSFEDWLKNIAVGPKNTFTYTDEEENSHTVRLMDTENPLKEEHNDLYGGIITLREEL